MSYIKFIERTPKKKTKVWEINTNTTPQYIIGYIQWHPQWRKYAFFPSADTVWEEVCLGEISNFIFEKTKEHKDRRNNDLGKR